MKKKKLQPPKVLVTKQYTRFKSARKPDPKKVKNLEKVINQNPNFLLQNPIWINGNGGIIDGLHRLEAAKNLGVPVPYTQEDHHIPIKEK